MLIDIIDYFLKALIVIIPIFIIFDFFINRKTTKTEVEVNNLDFLKDIIDGKTKFEDLTFYGCLLSPKYPKKLNFKNSWEFAQNFEVKDENYRNGGQPIELKVEAQAGNIYFTCPSIQWHDTNIKSQYFVLRLDNQIIITLTFEKIMETISGNFIINWPDDKILAIKGEVK